MYMYTKKCIFFTLPIVLLYIMTYNNKNKERLERIIYEN